MCKKMNLIVLREGAGNPRAIRTKMRTHDLLLLAMIVAFRRAVVFGFLLEQLDQLFSQGLVDVSLGAAHLWTSTAIA